MGNARRHDLTQLTQHQCSVQMS